MSKHEDRAEKMRGALEAVRLLVPEGHSIHNVAKAAIAEDERALAAIAACPHSRVYGEDRGKPWCADCGRALCVVCRNSPCQTPMACAATAQKPRLIKFTVSETTATRDNWCDGTTERLDEANAMMNRGETREPVSGALWSDIAAAWSAVVAAPLRRRGRGAQFRVECTAPAARVLLRSLEHWATAWWCESPLSDYQRAALRAVRKDVERLRNRIEAQS